MTVSDHGGLNVAAEIATLRGTMAEGFARIEGRLDLIAQKQDSTAEDLDELEGRVTALEARRVPWGLLSSVATVGGALGGLGAFLVGL